MPVGHPLFLLQKAFSCLDLYPPPSNSRSPIHHTHPMEALASVVGLIAAGAKVYGALHQLVTSCIDAPVHAHATCNEVRDFGYALTKLQPYVDGSSPIKRLGASATDVHHLSMTLTACVCTFSLLERRVDRLLPVARSTMTTLDRLKWTLAESDITQLVQRLQQHKSSLTLLLTIWIRFVGTPGLVVHN